MAKRSLTPKVDARRSRLEQSAVLLIRFSTLVLGQTKRPCQGAKHANTDKSSVLLVLANRNQKDFTDLRTMGQGFKAAGARVITFDTDRARFICLDHIHMTEPYHRLMAKLWLEVILGLPLSAGTK